MFHFEEKSLLLIIFNLKREHKIRARCIDHKTENNLQTSGIVQKQEGYNIHIPVFRISELIIWSDKSNTSLNGMKYKRTTWWYRP